MLDNQKIQNNWPHIKTQVLNKWNKLSEDEVEKTHGNSNSLSKLVQSKYGSIKDFDKTYEKICDSLAPSSKKPLTKVNGQGGNDIENRDARSPSAEAGLHDRTTEINFNESMRSGSPERRLNSNYAKVDHEANMNREADDELSAYSTLSRGSESIGDFDEDEDYLEEYLNNEDSEKADTQFTTPDEFYPSQDPSHGVDVPLGRNTSSATKISTAKAAPISSVVSFNDAKRKL